LIHSLNWYARTALSRTGNPISKPTQRRRMDTDKLSVIERLED
jgi:hypothetical protein